MSAVNDTKEQDSCGSGIDSLFLNGSVNVHARSPLSAASVGRLHHSRQSDKFRILLYIINEKEMESFNLAVKSKTDKKESKSLCSRKIDEGDVQIAVFLPDE